MTTLVLEDRMRTIYRTHSGVLFRTLMNWTYGDRQAAEDMVQETMVRAWRNIGTLNPDPMTLRPWLFAVARRIAVDRFRAVSARPREADPAPMELMSAPGEPYEQLIARETIKSALSGLSPIHRAALVHVYLLDQTLPEAAAELGVPVGTVKSRVYYALREVRAALDSGALNDRPLAAVN